jgi:hypothetical protein
MSKVVSTQEQVWALWTFSLYPNKYTDWVKTGGTYSKRVKLNPGLPWQKPHSTRRRLFLPANWT